MSKKDKNDKRGIVYSTNPDFKFQQSDGNAETPAPQAQTLYVSLQRLKGDKIATIIENFIGNDADLEALGKQLKTKCGGGGTVKDGVILIQGEHRYKIIAYLASQGYKTKRKGG